MRATGSSRFHALSRVLRATTTLVLLGLLSACATKRDIRDMQDLVSELHAQNQELLRQLQSSQQAQERDLSQLASDLQDTRAESARRFSNIEDQLLTVQELAGLGQQQLAALRDQYERDRRQSLGSAGAGGIGPDFGGGGQTGGAQELYRSSMTQYQRGSYATARMGLQQLVDQFGSDPLAPEARYWLAESLAAEGDTEAAIQAFLDVPAFHPTHERVPEAYYRAGTLHLEMGEEDLAREYFERVVNTWPDSDVADFARSELGNL